MSKEIHILLAEDEEHIAKLVEYKLRLEGYRLKVVQNGQEAIDQLGSEAWSLVILDVMMPLCDGWQVLQTLRSKYKADIPVLMLTAKGYPRDVAHAAELGATQFVRKPFDPNELALTVKKMVNS